MKPAEDLHQLIQSLSMSEKRFFKIHSSRHVIGGKNNYMRLFDAIARQDKYDEHEIKKKFHGETFIRHLPSEKHYLYGQVLDALNAYNRDKTFLSRYSNAIISIEILFNRGLFSHVRKLIKRVRPDAVRLEKFSTLLMLQRWETLVHIQAEDDKNLNRSLQEELRILDVIRNQTSIMRIAFNIQVQIDKGKATPRFIRETERELRKIFPPPPDIMSFWSKYYFHSGIGLLATVSGKLLLRYTSYKEIKRTMDNSPQFIGELPVIYHINMNNLVNVMFFLEKYDEVESLIGRQRVFLSENHLHIPNLERLVFYNTAESELFLYYKTGRHEKAAVLAHSIGNDIRRAGANAHPSMYDLIFFMAVSMLMIGNYKEATKWLNRILNAEKKINLRKELLITSRILYLVILYETHDLLFENRLRAARRYVQNEPLFGIHAETLDIFSMLVSFHAGKKNRAELVKRISLLRKEVIRANEKSLNKQFDFAGWMEKKIRFQS
ncbi:MAG TPA: hypothetical protein VFU15_01140 [Bacteroidia bacterium]|nr:hypothetical protein [Bacteroidia bacterium]